MHTLALSGTHLDIAGQTLTPKYMRADLSEKCRQYVGPAEILVAMNPPDLVPASSFEISQRWQQHTKFRSRLIEPITDFQHHLTFLNKTQGRRIYWCGIWEGGKSTHAILLWIDISCTKFKRKLSIKSPQTSPSSLTGQQTGYRVFVGWPFSILWPGDQEGHQCFAFLEI